MAENTKIEWTHRVLPDGSIVRGHTHNFWRGCDQKVLPDGSLHPGCEHCYAMTMAKRNPGSLGVWGAENQGGTRVVAVEKTFTAPLKWNKRAEANGQREIVFCDSMSDFFEDWNGPMVDSRGRQLFACPHCGFVDHTEQGIDGFKEQGNNGSGEVLYYCCKTRVVVRPATMKDVRRRAFEIIDACPWLIWIIATKRPENVRRMWPSADVFDDKSEHKAYWPNVWLLTSVSDQATADVMIPELLKCRDLVPVLGISAEPLLGAIDLREFVGYGSYNGNIPGRCVNIDGESIHAEGRKCRQCGWGYPDDPDYPRRVAGLDWVIVGGESGHGARPMHPDWARSLRDQCTAAGVPLFLKQWGEWIPSGQVLPIHQPDSDDDPKYCLMADKVRMLRVGKKAAGKLLDGREWNEFPGVVHA